jgi:hypothetical protein
MRPGRCCSELFAHASEECIGTYHQSARSLLEQGRENDVEVAFAAGMQDMELKPKDDSGCLQVSRLGLCKSGIGWIDKQGVGRSCGNHLLQQLQPLLPYLRGQTGHAGEIAARPVEARNDDVFCHAISYLTKDGFIDFAPSPEQ